MKKIFILLFCFIALNAFTQVVDEKTKKLFTFGLDVYTDLWQDVPSTLEPRTINQGVNVFGTYNFIFGESNFSFSPGIGLGIHNLYSSSLLHVNNDSAYFVPVEDELSEEYLKEFKKSKLVTPYLDIPLEIRFKSKSNFRIALGFKFGFLLRAYTKYKGDDYLEELQKTTIYKKKMIYKDYLEQNRYGFIGRIGYKWLNVYGYYQLSSLFVKEKGPEMYPISVGITIIPF